MRFLSAFAGAVLIAIALPCVATAQTAGPDFGTPPSSVVPILFNDHHVYAKPDELKNGRLLAALVKGKTILVPLRSLFEQVGATVDYDGATQTATFRRGGSSVSVTVGKPEVVIDGQTRPLDVPPVLFQGVVMVPVRVLAESFGAYVAYLPSIRVVSVRYIPAGPAPAVTPVPLQASTPAPSPTPYVRATVPPGPPIPVGTPQPETYLVADVLISPKVDNEFSPGETGATGQSFAGRFDSEFTFLDINLDAGVSFTQDAYTHPNGFVTEIGGGGQTFVPAFIARDKLLEARFGIQLSPQKFYLDAGYASLGSDYGYPSARGFGIGLDKLPVLDRRLSYDGSIFFYPNLSGACNAADCPPSVSTINYRLITYRAGLALAFDRVFLDGGFRGDDGHAKSGAPASFTHSGPYAGLGFRF